MEFVFKCPVKKLKSIVKDLPIFYVFFFFWYFMIRMRYFGGACSTRAFRHSTNESQRRHVGPLLRRSDARVDITARFR